MKVNIVVFQNKLSTNSFQHIKSKLFSIISPNSYVCYPADFDNETLARLPWQKGAKMAIIDKIEHEELKRYKNLLTDYMHHFKGTLLIENVKKKETKKYIKEWMILLEIEKVDCKNEYIKWDIKNGGTLVYSDKDLFENSEILSKILGILNFRMNDKTQETIPTQLPFFLYGALNVSI